MSLPIDLKNYAEPRPRVAEYALATIAALLTLTFWLEGNIHDNAASQTAIPSVLPLGSAVAAPMPPTPGFEEPHRLMQMSVPVPCSGKHNTKGWISHNGDRVNTGRKCT